MSEFKAHEIGKKDVIWNYLATIFQISSSVILFPLILYKFKSETIGIWSIFTMISTFVLMLDFGFTPSFTRNITYVFSGVKKLSYKGIDTNNLSTSVNYELLNETIKAMRWFYRRIGSIALVLMMTIGTVYLVGILKKNYTENISEILFAWILFCITNTYNIFTLYYDALLTGAGKQIVSKKILILSQIFYLVIASVLLYFNLGLHAIVIGQAVSLFVKRILSYYKFFTPNIQLLLKENTAQSDRFKEIIQILAPNSIKVGLTSLGAFLVSQSSIIFGSLYLSLETLATYGITVQLINILASLSLVYYNSYTPKITYFRVQNDKSNLLKIYKKSVILMLITFALGTFIMLGFGNRVLILIESKTLLLESGMSLVLIIIAFLEKNHSLAGGFLLLKNEVPFFKASLISGVVTILLMYLFIKFDFGLWSLIIAPGIVQAAYQNWKWPSVLLRELTKK